MLLDFLGREITRRKQYGLTRGPHEYVLADPAAAELDVVADLCDGIADLQFDLPDELEENQGLPLT